MTEPLSPRLRFWQAINDHRESTGAEPLTFGDAAQLWTETVDRAAVMVFRRRLGELGVEQARAQIKASGG